VAAIDAQIAGRDIEVLRTTALGPRTRVPYKERLLDDDTGTLVALGDMG
jgi:hypothetical protein